MIFQTAYKVSYSWDAQKSFNLINNSLLNEATDGQPAKDYTLTKLHFHEMFYKWLTQIRRKKHDRVNEFENVTSNYFNTSTSLVNFLVANLHD